MVRRRTWGGFAVALLLLTSGAGATAQTSISENRLVALNPGAAHSV